ncbi:MAG: single-stranded DNA-binding protein [Nanoarchaeota archaeon]
MSADNNCNFVGRLTRDPELRYTSGGTPYCFFPIAVYSYYDKKNDEEKSSFPLLKVYGKRAENISKNLDKGQLVSATCEYRSSYNKEKDTNHNYFLIRDIRFKNKASG